MIWRRRRRIPEVRIRLAQAHDAPGLAALSAEAIRRSAAGHYSEGEREAWAQRRTAGAHERMIGTTHALVACAGDELAGFASLALEPVGDLVRGEVDQLFVAPAFGGRGVARALLDAIEQAARDAGIDTLVTHASWRAEPVFTRRGYERAEVEQVDLGGETLGRVRMVKRLG